MNIIRSSSHNPYECLPHQDLQEEISICLCSSSWQCPHSTLVLLDCTRLLNGHIFFRCMMNLKICFIIYEKEIIAIIFKANKRRLCLSTRAEMITIEYMTGSRPFLPSFLPLLSLSSLFYVPPCLPVKVLALPPACMQSLQQRKENLTSYETLKKNKQSALYQVQNKFSFKAKVQVAVNKQISSTRTLVKTISQSILYTWSLLSSCGK